MTEQFIRSLNGYPLRDEHAQERIDGLDSKKLDADKLTEATDAALAQAKASGEFDGEPGAAGKTAYQYAKDGGYTGTESEFAAKLAETSVSVMQQSLSEAQKAQARANIGAGRAVDHFKGMTAAFYGDSLTEVNRHYTLGYHYWLSTILELSEYANYGVSGYKISDVYNKVLDTTDNADIVFVMAGVNDQTFSVPLGTLGDTATDTTYGALENLCAALKAKYPTSIIVYITPHYQTGYKHANGVTSYEISKAIKEVCGKYAIPVYDNFVLSGIYSTNLSVFTTDNCHWNNTAHEMVGKNLARYMQSTFGYAYGAMPDSGGDADYTNLVPTSIDTDNSIYNGTGYKDDTRLSSSGGVSSTAQTGSVAIGFIPYTAADVVRMKGAVWMREQISAGHFYFIVYDENKEFLCAISASAYDSGSYGTEFVNYDAATGVTTFDARTSNFTDFVGAAYFRLNAYGKGEDLIVTVNQEIT